jgi:hypothetical protein
MHVSLFDQYGALNSVPVFSAIKEGLTRLGIQTSHHNMDADVAVIWSFLWAGRMLPNKQVYEHYRNTGRQVLIAEVGMLKRGITWKLCLNSTVSGGTYGKGKDPERANKLGLKLKPWTNSGTNILIALQRSDSGQWAPGSKLEFHFGPPTTEEWLKNTVDHLRNFTNRPIVVRPHPRQSVVMPTGVTVQRPRKLATDHFDFDSALIDTWAVVNHNSGPGSQAIIAGVPAFVGLSSLAAPVSNVTMGNIENPDRPNREEWLNQIAHTEWTVEEIATGLPLARLLQT